jgi:arylsulfatase A-like enzyme
MNIMKYLYLGAVRQVDRHLRELFGRISDEALENILVIIFVDHSEAFDEHGESGYSDVIPEVCQPPLIAYDPSDTVSPEIVDDPVGLMQIYQTIGNVAGIELPSYKSQSVLSNRMDSIVFIHRLSNPAHEFLMGKYAVWRSESDYVIWDGIDDTYHYHRNTRGLELELQNYIDELDHTTPKSASEMEEYTKEQSNKRGI